MKKKAFDLLTLGEILLRLSPPDNERIVRGETFQKQVGGAELNVASGVSLLGLRSGIISRIPDSSIGMFAKNKIRFCGVSDDYLVYDTGKDARLGVYYYENGAYPRKPGVVYDRQHSSMTRIDIDEFDDSIYESTRCFHTSGITLALSEECRKTGVEMIKRFKEKCALFSFDVNFRLNLWSGEEARKCIEGILPYVDIFFCSEDTARLTFGKTGTINEIQKSFCEEYPISVVASTERTVITPKKHNFTSIIYSAKNDTYYRENPYNNIDVVDRIGSGDAYVSGALYGYLKHGACQKALEYGNAMAAIKHSVIGDMVFTDFEEIDSIIKKHKNTSGYQSEMNR